MKIFPPDSTFISQVIQSSIKESDAKPIHSEYNEGVLYDIYSVEGALYIYEYSGPDSSLIRVLKFNSLLGALSFLKLKTGESYVI